MTRHRVAIRIAAAAAIVAAITAGGTAAGPAQAAAPETVIVTFHAKAGSEAELAAVIARHWDTARRLNLVLDSPHLTVRGTEGDRQVYFVDIFAWRDASVPDHAPAEIQKIWADMNRLVEARNGKPGLEFSEVAVADK
jgi:hypothetical protein